MIRIKLIVLSILLSVSVFSQSDRTSLLTFDASMDAYTLEIKPITDELGQPSVLSLNNLDEAWLETGNLSEYWQKVYVQPTGMSPFWLCFTLGAVGTYSLYGVGVAPAAVLVIYLVSDGDKQKTRQAAWGALSGMIVGGVVKFAVLSAR